MATDITNIAKTAIRSEKYMDMVVSDCHFGGFIRSIFGHFINTFTQKSNIHMDDCSFTKFGGEFPFISSPIIHDQASATFTGCAFVQSIGAVDDPGIRAPIRINSTAFSHLRGCDFFHTDSSQPCIKFCETPEVDGLVVNIHSCSLEGGLYPLSFGNNAFASNKGLHRSSVHNMVVDGLVILGDYGTQHMIRSALTGLTARNCLVVHPDTPKGPLTRFLSFIRLLETSPFDATIVGAAPVRFYNNTFRSDRANIDNNGSPPLFLDDITGGLFSAVSEDNNILHTPNATPAEIESIPLSEVALWAPRGIGRRDKDTYVLDTAFAPDAGALMDTKPEVNSPALGDALMGNVSYQDILMQKRPEPPSKGAWEAE